jgi:hypothetical protein
MVRRTEGAVAHQRLAGGELVGHRVNAGHIQRFFDSQFRQNAGHGAGDERSAGAGRTAHQHVMAPGCGYFKGTFYMFLALDLNVKRYPITLRLTLNLSVKICR